MPDNILNALEFEERIKEMNDRALLEFTARQTYSVVLIVTKHENRIKKLENRDRKYLGAIGGVGGISALVGAAIAGMIDFFLKR